MPPPDDTGGAGSNLGRSNSVPRSVRGGGYTCPRPDYDGSGGAEYGTFLGLVAPLSNEPPDSLINPVDPYTGGHGIGGEMPGSGDFIPLDDTPGRYYIQADPQLAQQREMEEIQRIMGNVLGQPADGLFGFSGSLKCDEPAPERTAENCYAELLAIVKRIERRLGRDMGRSQARTKTSRTSGASSGSRNLRKRPS
jgi:hypothetical protein